jgi:hypothetical protein
MPVRKYWTLSQIREKIRQDLDLEAETFIRPSEMDAYINEAIDEAEAEIHTLYEDYFMARENISLVANQEEYDLPADIYGHKIRRITYNNTSSVYTVRRIQDWKKFEKYEIAKNFQTSDLYQYFLMNETAGSPKILLVPEARETGPNLQIWYLRQANRLEADSDICDIPEFVNFIFQYVKVRIYEKEGHPNVTKAVQDLEKQRQLMNGTLASMTPDAENKIEMDMSYYEEFN